MVDMKRVVFLEVVIYIFKIVHGIKNKINCFASLRVSDVGLKLATT